MAIEVRDLGYIYGKKTPYEMRALNKISLHIEKGEFLAIIGHTGSGKSTFIQHLNGLIKLTEGKLRVLDIDLNVKKPDYKRLRTTVGMVFQYPEYQLFDETVAKDVGFGPRNMGLEKEEIDKRVKEAIELVGLSYEEVAERSPFELSGGQKRRVAIAGVIAMKPEVLVLDEPTAGLDPKGKRDIIALVQKLKQEVCHTVIMVSHDMDLVAETATKVAVLKDGELKAYLPPVQLFANRQGIAEWGLDIPYSAKIADCLRDLGMELSDKCITPENLANEILAWGGKNE